MIEIIDDLLNKSELIFLNEKMTDDLNDFSIKPTEFIYRYYKIPITKLEYSNKLTDYYNKIEKYINLNIFSIDTITLNCVTDNMPYGDGFHKDKCDKTIITYLNNNFNGGNFEYIINDKIKSITPIKNRTIILNSKIQHRVLPVSKGFRYSLVTFCNLKPNNIKKLF